MSPGLPLAVALLAAATVLPGLAQELATAPLINVEHYTIDARVDMEARLLEATAEVHFVAVDPAPVVTFELHNDLNVDAVETEDGTSLFHSRGFGNSTVEVSFPGPLAAGERQVVRFRYGGRLVGYENSPAEGYAVAEIEPDRAILLYAGRWFPVNGYGADRFTSRIQVTVPDGIRVLGSGTGLRTEALEGIEHTFEFSYPSFPGTVALVREEPLQAGDGDATVSVYMPRASESLAREYGETAAEMVGYYSELYGAPWSKSLVIVETGEFAPNGYWAPGMVLLSPYGRREALNRQLLGRLVANQWWGTLVGPGNRNHLWLADGLAAYSALMEVEEAEGEDAFIEALGNARVNALTFDEVPLTQSSRVTDFSPQMEALTAGRGAMVMHMLRWGVGDEAFFSTLRGLLADHAWETLTTNEFREIFETSTGKDLDSFFLQWTETTVTPEFEQEFTIYRLGGNEGFRVIGRINQDMDTFSMPVELKVETEGEPEFHLVQVTGTAADFQLETFGKPKQVVLDPHHRILRLDDATRVRVAIRRGEQLIELGYYSDALIEYQQALDINRFSSLAHYRLGEAMFLMNNYQGAANEFREALNGDRDPEWTEVWSHINLGKIFDITGQRDRAVNEYQLAVRTRDNTQNAQNEASKHLASPYRRPRPEERTY